MVDTNYSKNYYQKNKEDIKEQKHFRYLTDPEYAKKIKERSRKRYQEKMKSPDKKVGYTVKKINGVTLFTITYAAKMIEHGKDFIRGWEKSGHIPPTSFTDKRGWRLYTGDQIKLLIDVFHLYDSDIYTKDDVKRELHKNWRSHEKR